MVIWEARGKSRGRREGRSLGIVRRVEGWEGEDGEKEGEGKGRGLRGKGGWRCFGLEVLKRIRIENLFLSAYINLIPRVQLSS